MLTNRAGFTEEKMTQNEKLKKVCDDFSKLNEEQQDYILGILQALVFAKTTSQNSETVPHIGIKTEIS
jgi:hypothetical protein